ncbi:MAG: kelch repeat-containing protein [Bryobacteraceae bacterium]
MTRRGFLFTASSSSLSFAQPPAALSLRWGDGPSYPMFVKGGAMGAFADAVAYVGGSTYPWRESEAGWYFEPENGWTPAAPGSITSDAKKALLGGGWKPLPAMPVGRAYTHGTAIDDSLVVVGGRWQMHGCREVFQLKRMSKADWRWEALPSLQQARCVPGVAAIGSLLIAAHGGDWDRVRGGAFTPRDVTLVEGLDLRAKQKGWRTLAPCPGGARVGAMTAAVNGRMYVFGGYDLWYENNQRRIKNLSDAYRYDPSTDRWEQLPALPAGARNCGAVAWKDRYILLIGGIMEIPGGGGEVHQSIVVDPKRRVVMGQYSNRVMVYDTESRTYSSVNSLMPRGHGDIRACVMGSRVYALGGENVDVTLSNCTNDFMVGEPA